MKKGKTRISVVIGFGIAAAFASSLGASERTRSSAGGEAVTDPIEAAPEVPQVGVTTQIIAADVALNTTPNGQQYRVYADGHIDFDEIVKAFGSIERWQFEMEVANVPSTTAPDGTRVYANGAIGWFADLVGSDFPKPPARTVEELKAEVPWIEVTIEGVKVLSFANGAILNDPDVNQFVPAWSEHRMKVPFRVGADGTRTYADGSVFWGEPPAAHDN